MPRATADSFGGRCHRDDRGQRRGPRHGVQPEARTPRREQRCAAQRRQLTCAGRSALHAAAAGAEADEDQAHRNGDHPADTLQQGLIGDHRRRHAEHRDAAESRNTDVKPATNSAGRAPTTRHLPARRDPPDTGLLADPAPHPPDRTDSRAPAAPHTASAKDTRPASTLTPRASSTGPLATVTSAGFTARQPDRRPPAVDRRPAARAGTPRQQGSGRRPSGAG